MSDGGLFCGCDIINLNAYTYIYIYISTNRDGGPPEVFKCSANCSETLLVYGATLHIWYIIYTEVVYEQEDAASLSIYVLLCGRDAHFPH